MVEFDDRIKRLEDKSPDDVDFNTAVDAMGILTAEEMKIVEKFSQLRDSIGSEAAKAACAGIDEIDEKWKAEYYRLAEMSPDQRQRERYKQMNSRWGK